MPSWSKLDLRLRLANVWPQGIETDENGTKWNQRHLCPHLYRDSCLSRSFDVRTVSWADGSQFSTAWEVDSVFTSLMLAVDKSCFRDTDFYSIIRTILDFEIPSGWRLNTSHLVNEQICDEAVTSLLVHLISGQLRVFGSIDWWSSVCC